MTINPKEYRGLYNKLKDHYPQTFEWAKHKARRECMPLGAVFNEYKDYIAELMAKEAKPMTNCKGGKP